MNWQSVLRDNWHYKVAALFIVFLLWLDVTAGERQSQEVTTRVTVEVQDTAWVLVEAADRVATTFQGRNRELLALVADDPQIRIAIREVTGPTMRVPLDADLVEYDRDLGARATLVVPTTLELHFEPLMERRVPISADLVTVPALGYTVLRPILLDPDSVTIKGGESEVERVRQVATRRVTIEDLRNPVVRDIPLESPAGARSIELDPTSVLVTIPVDSLVVRQVRLPVRVTGAAARSVDVSPDSVDVVVRGAWSAVRRQIDAMPFASVGVESEPTGVGTVPVRVEMTSGGFVSVSVAPPEVSVRRKRS